MPTLQDNAPQTTPSTVDDNQIQPSAQPQAPASTPPSTQAPSAPQNQAPSVQPQPQKVQPQRSWFDLALQGMAGGPTRVQDPQTGVTREVPMSKKSLSAHILAGAIAGILNGAAASSNAPSGPAGTNTPANMAALAGGAQGTQDKLQQIRNAPQQQLDADQLSKYQTMKRNIDLAQGMLTLGNASREAQDKVDDTGKTLLQQVDDYSPALIPEDNRGLTHAEIMQKFPKLSENNFIPMGHRDILNPDGTPMIDQKTGAPYREPLFAVVPPSAQVPMTDELREAFGQYNPTIKQIPIGTVVSLNHFLSMNTQHIAQVGATDALKQSAEQVAAVTGRSAADVSKAIMSDPVLRRNAATIGKYLGHGNSIPDAIQAMQKDKDVDDAVIQRVSRVLGLGEVIDGKSVAQRLADKAAQEKAADKSLTVNEAETIVTNPNASKEDKARAKAFLDDTDNREVAKENRKNDARAAAEDDRQTKKDIRTKVYAMDANGNLILSNYHDNPGGETVKDSDVMKDRSAMRQLGDVQVNTTRYAQSLRKPITATDTDKMQEIMALNQQTGGTGVNFGQGGISLNIPVISAKLSKQNLKQMTDDLALLSPAARDRLTGYLRTAASVPAYQKAIAGTARSNKETLDLELANIPMPYYDAATAGERLSAWQENIDRASKGYPTNLAGMIHPNQLKSQMEGPNGGVVVILPNGGTVTVKDQAAADALKQEAGIR